MIHSRREILKNTVIAGLGGAVAALQGCQSSSNSPAQLSPTPPSSFVSGIRLFFIGSWLFAADPDYQDGSRILALSLDLNSAAHKVARGKYDKNMNKNGPFLIPSGSKKTHKVDIDTTSKSSIKDIFKDAAENRVLLWSPGAKLKSDLSAISSIDQRLMTISVPKPNQIVTSDFLEGSSIVAEPGMLDRPIPDKPGAPAAFIFDYQGATTFSSDFDPQPAIQAGTDSNADYHFRVVPDNCPDHYHPSLMFTNLMQLVDWKGAQPVLNLGVSESIQRGDFVPSQILDDELDIPNMSQPCPTRSLRTGACAGGGGAIGP